MLVWHIVPTGAPAGCAGEVGTTAARGDMQGGPETRDLSKQGSLGGCVFVFNRAALVYAPDNYNTCIKPCCSYR